MVIWGPNYAQCEVPLRSQVIKQRDIVGDCHQSFFGTKFKVECIMWIDPWTRYQFRKSSQTCLLTFFFHRDDYPLLVYLFLGGVYIITMSQGRFIKEKRAAVMLCIEIENSLILFTSYQRLKRKKIYHKRAVLFTDDPHTRH